MGRRTRADRGKARRACEWTEGWRTRAEGAARVDGGDARERKRDGAASGRGRERTRGFRAVAALLVVGAALDL